MKVEVNREDFTKETLVYQIPFSQALIAEFRSPKKLTEFECAVFPSRGAGVNSGRLVETQGTKTPAALVVCGTSILERRLKEKKVSAGQLISLKNNGRKSFNHHNYKIVLSDFLAD